ncbi:phage terminase small subunit P27 family [Kaistia defluvii]|uniref:phage terminase small subunit P27 family n=1 Tax=Kaistia defluvii TaxID=410841 RepID=UPI002254A45F|nr:phage terminase small subunit P27 family [Kaistia defluvii]MCX5518460.1 phage terminase small subunit P27 family [Kaistia defluvii]
MRGRRPDIATQDEKGNPGKRRKAKPSINDRIKILAEAPPASSDALSPPLLFGLDEFAGAVQIWNEYVPELRRRNVLDRLDRHSMAMFCYYLDRFWSAVKRLAQDGETQRVRTTSGGYRIHDHPAVAHRDDAAKIVMDLSVRFGFTPLDRYKLIREMVGTGAPAGQLFGDNPGHGKDHAEQPSEELSDANSIAGFARRNSSMPN